MTSKNFLSFPPTILSVFPSLASGASKSFCVLKKKKLARSRAKEKNFFKNGVEEVQERSFVGTGAGACGQGFFNSFSFFVHAKLSPLALLGGERRNLIYISLFQNLCAGGGGVYENKIVQIIHRSYYDLGG